MTIRAANDPQHERDTVSRGWLVGMSGPRQRRVHRVRAPVLGVQPGVRAAVGPAGGAVLRRPMMLGPAPEYALAREAPEQAVLAGEAPGLPWPVRPTGPHAV